MPSFEETGGQASIASVTDRVRPVAIETSVTSVHFLDDRAVFVGGEEIVAMVDRQGALSKVGVHSGGILCAAR